MATEVVDSKSTCFCVYRECLRGHIDAAASAVVDCPFANDDYCCESQLQEREIRAVCTILNSFFLVHGCNMLQIFFTVVY